MNEYLMSFQRITQSIEPVLKNEQNSPETKQSVAQLKQSFTPCFKEIQQSATRLKTLMKVCFDDLAHTEDVWDSKQRVAEISTYEIWGKIGDVSGCNIRVRHLSRQYKSEVINQVKNDWYKRELLIKDKHFYDNKQKFKNALSVFEKDSFIIRLRCELQAQIKVLQSVIIDSINLLVGSELETHIPFLQRCIGQLDKQQAKELVTQFNSIASTIANLVERAFSERFYILPVNVKSLVDALDNTADTLAKQGVLGISWEQFDKCSKEVLTKLETIVTTIFDEFVKLVEQAVEQGLTFYSDFLDRQVRYRQETIEQREAEKAWIDEQYRELMRVQDGIDAILLGSTNYT
ncbi:MULTISPECIES: hypothetical protein [Nostocales]|uniref:Aspartate/glutamate racemase family protein n=3 Tax=Nostocales TaxID=1161 RepID=A0A0C1N1T2_9CYAN|nr:hypothetical protein [Tolypothrix bouteillei]KAF3883788.1 aspartate/glutamate racemase family protein [Tolypothrix bouteillei VB521301]